MADLSAVSTAELLAAMPKTPETFAAQYGAAAQRASAQIGVDPQVLLGQWGHETGWGKSVIPGTNNLGNIKDPTGQGPTFPSVLMVLGRFFHAWRTQMFHLNGSGILKIGQSPHQVRTLGLRFGQYPNKPSLLPIRLRTWRWQSQSRMCAT